MARKAKTKRKRVPKSILELPDLEQTKSAVLNGLTSPSSQRSYDHAIREFIDWYCSEPRLGEKVLSGREGGKAQAKRVTPEHRKDSGTKPSKSKALRLLESVSGTQIRDFEDGPEGPIISVAR